MLKAVLLDFDGVIVDSRKATVEYFQETFRHSHLPSSTYEQFIPLFGLKTLDITKRLLPDKTDDEILPIFEYSKIMSMKYVPKIDVVSYAKETLLKLQKHYKLALVTSRSKETVRALFEIHGLNDFFEVVIDREDVAHHKPHPEGMLNAIESLGINRSEAIYVGDTNEDIEAAHNAGLPCVIISSTFIAGAKYTIDTIQQLPDFIQKTFAI